MYLFIKFVHVIAAMVFFGLPFAFGRWYQAITLSQEPSVWSYTIGRIRLFLVLHMNFCAALLLATGLWLTRSMPRIPDWAWAALFLLILALVNINGNLYRTLCRYDTRPEPTKVLALRRRLSLFMALHHTLVTAATALMVVRWP